MFVRSSHNPILKPDKNVNWRSLKVYNPTVLFENNKYHLFYRAVGKDKISRIGYAESSDGEKFVKQKKPSLSPGSKSEARGVEDPRITGIGGSYFLTYTAYDGKRAILCSAVSSDLKIWKKFGSALHNWNKFRAGGFSVNWDGPVQDNPVESKAGGIFPQKIGGHYEMLFGDCNLWFARSKNSRLWQADNMPFIRPRRGFFDSVHVEMGPPPIRTKYGWLVLYHGINNEIVYRLGYLLLDLKNPRKIIKRSKKPIFEPRANYELKGLVDIAKNRHPKIIFCNGAVLIGDTLKIYYGASDSVICTASAKLEDIVSAA